MSEKSVPESFPESSKVEADLEPEKSGPGDVLRSLPAFLGKVVLLAVFVFLGTELALRFLQVPTLQYYRNIKLLHVYHPDYKVGLASGVDLQINHYLKRWQGRFTTNSSGYRGSPEPDPNQNKLLCLGDSMVMGFGVSDHQTFCALLNGSKIQGEPYQALNLGVDAFGSLGNAKRLAEAAARLRGAGGDSENVKIKALFFVSPNDFYMPEELRKRNQKSDDEKELFWDIPGWHKTFFRTQFELTRWSYTLHALKLAYENLRIKYALTKGGIKAEFHEFMDSRVKYFFCSFYKDPPGSLCKAKGPKEKQQDKKASGGAGSQGELKNAGKFWKYPDEFLLSSYQIPQKHSPENPLLGPVFRPTFRLEKIKLDHCLASPPAVPVLPDATVKAYEKMISAARKYNIDIIPVMLPIQDRDLECASVGLYSKYFVYALQAGTYFRKQGLRVLDIRPEVWRLITEQADKKMILNMPKVIIPNDGHYTACGNLWAAGAIRRTLLNTGTGNEARGETESCMLE